MSLIIDSLAKLAEKFSQKYPGEASGIATLDGSGDVVEPVLKVEAGGVDLRCKVIDIGDWDMDAASNVDVAHGLTAANIRSVSVVIRDDAESLRYVIDDGEGSALNISGVQFNNTNVSIYRTTGGGFDDVDFNSTSYNRGWIIIWYVP